MAQLLLSASQTCFSAPGREGASRQGVASDLTPGEGGEQLLDGAYTAHTDKCSYFCIAAELHAAHAAHAAHIAGGTT